MVIEIIITTDEIFEAETFFDVEDLIEEEDINTNHEYRSTFSAAKFTDQAVSKQQSPKNLQTQPSQKRQSSVLSTA